MLTPSRMISSELSLLIQRRIDAGLLPRDVRRIWGAFANADTCDACDEVIPGNEYVIDGISIGGGAKTVVQLHVECFAVWDELRQRDSG